MSDWQKGDMAELIDRNLISCGSARHNATRTGSRRYRTVESVEPSRNTNGVITCKCVRLRFSDGTHGITQRFRKVEPLKPTVEDMGIISLMSRKPVEV